jgi:polygalacturonase
VRITGPIHLRSNVNLHVAEGAELRFSDKFEDYLPVVYMQRGGTRCYNYSPLIYARDCTNIAVTGKGTLNGQGQAWWPWKKRQPGMTRLFQMGADQVPVEQRVFGTEADGVRTCFIQPIDCKNVLLEGFTVVNGPSWNVHPVTCENLTVRGVSVTTLGPNNDGINPDSCRNVIVEDCFLDTGDDCICLKAGRNEDGWAVGKPCENVVVRRCRTKRGHGGIVMGSEMSAGIRNVFVHDCRFEGTQRGIRLKSLPGRGGALENLWFQDIVMDRVGAAVHMTLRYPGASSDRDRMPKFHNIHIRNLACENARVAVEMFGLPDADTISDVTIEDVAIASRTGLQVEYVHDLRLRRVALKPERSPVMRFRNSRDVTIEQLASPEGAEVFLQVEGAGSKNIRLSKVDLSGAARAVVLGDGVPQGAVVANSQG